VNLVYTERFAEAASKLSKEARAKLPKALKLLAEDPRHPSLQTKKIQGLSEREIFEARLDQKIRFSFQVQGDFIILRNIDDHDVCLGNP
jgi:mRNA-degrading endonuclease RelE of RelBE toxin-antitoxin system